MGTKFANIQVKSASYEAVKTLFPKSIVRVLSPDWVTVVDEVFEWGTVEKEARRISKKLQEPVLTVEYFDDDFVQFTVYAHGKQMAKHIPASYEGVEAKHCTPKKWVTSLGLLETTMKDCKFVLKECDVECSLKLMESVLQCVLWVDREMIEDHLSPNPYSKLETYMQEKQDEAKAKKKIKNATKLTQVDEVAGGFSKYKNPSCYFTTTDIDYIYQSWKMNEQGVIHATRVTTPECASVPQIIPFISKEKMDITAISFHKTEEILEIGRAHV